MKKVIDWRLGSITKSNTDELLDIPESENLKLDNSL